MNRAVLFVHGTGVRGNSYASSFALVKGSLPTDVHFSGCFWGQEYGARLVANGASIPSYRRTGGSGDLIEEELALWAVLYTDPWYQLRQLRDVSHQDTDLPPGVESPAVKLRTQIEQFQCSPELRMDLEGAQLAGAFDDALAAVLAAPEFDEAAQTADYENPLEHRQAVARAVIAHTLVSSDSIVDGETRDSLVERLANELHGYGRGIGTRLVRPFAGIARHVVTQLMSRRRGSITDATTPAAGDILLYQARGQGIRAAVRRAIQDIRAEKVALLAHSLGGIACVDLLVESNVPEVDRLITVGSQASFLYEIGALTSLLPPTQLPDHFPAWLNIYDPRDFLSYLGQPIFPGRVTDVQVDNRQPFPQAHTAYWGNRSVWAAVEDFLS